MQPQQPDAQRTDRHSSAGDAIGVTADVMIEPEAVGAAIGVVGDYTQHGAELVLDGVSIVFELAGELLSGLSS